MAYRLDFSEQFEKSTAKTAKWLKKEWSFNSAQKFQDKLAVAIEKVIANPFIGQRSHKFEDIRSVLVQLITDFTIVSLILLFLFLS
jgi:hypothetical protein